MSTKEKLTADMKQAMKDREAGKLRLGVIRMLRADIRNAEINNKGKAELSEEEVLAVIMKAVKMREDSLAEFTKAGRQDLVDQTKAELEVLNAYLPEQLSDEELTDIVKKAIESIGATGMKEMGKIMKTVMPQVQGRADGRRINTIVRDLLK